MAWLGLAMVKPRLARWVFVGAAVVGVVLVRAELSPTSALGPSFVYLGRLRGYALRPGLKEVRSELL